MAASIPPKAPPGAADVMAQLAAARDEVAAAAAKSRALRQQSQAEGLAQAARLAQDDGDDGRARALADEVDRVRAQILDVKA